MVLFCAIDAMPPFLENRKVKSLENRDDDGESRPRILLYVLISFSIPKPWINKKEGL
jgi:hypothetical protein